MQTEDNLLGSFYSRQHNKSGKGYLEFVADDQRQSKRLAVNDLATEGGTNLPISILGGGPISNIFTVQASLYAKNTRVYQILQGCKDVNQFFLGKCGSEKKPDNPNSQGKSEPSDKDLNKLARQAVQRVVRVRHRPGSAPAALARSQALAGPAHVSRPKSL